MTVSDEQLEVFFWEPTVSPHKMALAGALAMAPNVASVFYIAQSKLSDQRRSQGWSVSIPAQVVGIVEPGPNEIKDVVSRSSPQSIHLFSGFRNLPCLVNGLAAVRASGKRFGIMSEPRASEGLRGRVRFIQSWLTEGELRRDADFVLAIGRNGPPWFTATGYSPDRIFPFGYFVAASTARQVHRIGAGRHTVRISFLGRLNCEKGIDIVLQCLKLLPNDIELHIAGVGPEIDRVLHATREDHAVVVYHGAIPMKDVPEYLRSMDILVLPSITTDDGWGAVVSEALLVGTAVVTTQKVGASVCIDDDTRGRVMKQLTPFALAAEIDWLIKNNRLTGKYRELRQGWASSRLTGEAGAKHLMEIFAHLYAGAPRPAAFFED